MGIRLPLKTILNVADTATSGTVTYPFTVPQDCDNVVVKFYTGATFTGTNPTLDVYVQTSDDGGTTWYDCCNIGQITATVSAQNARWASIPVGGFSNRSAISGSSSTAGGTTPVSVAAIGTAAASNTGTLSYTGVPILAGGPGANRVYLKYGGTQLTNTAANVLVYANSQSPQP